MKQYRYPEEKVKSAVAMRTKGIALREIARSLNLNLAALSNFYRRKELSQEEKKLFMINR